MKQDHRCDLGSFLTPHEPALFCSWIGLTRSGFWPKQITGWLCEPCRAAQKATLLEQPERKRAHTHRSREWDGDAD